MKYKIPPHLRFCRPSPELRTLSCYSLKLLFVFDIEDHIHSSLVAASLILIVQPLIHDHLGHLHAYYAGSEGQYVGVVMLTGHSCAVWLAAGSD